MIVSFSLFLQIDRSDLFDRGLNRITSMSKIYLHDIQVGQKNIYTIIKLRDWQIIKNE